MDYETPVEDQNNMYYYSGSSDEMTTSSKYPFYVSVANGEGLMLGQHVYIELDNGGEEEETGLMIPSYLLVVEGEQVFAWVANDKDKLEKRELTVGTFDEMMGEYEILDGLTADDYIAIPEEGLEEGQNVTRYDESSFGGENGAMAETAVAY